MVGVDGVGEVSVVVVGEALVEPGAGVVWADLDGFGGGFEGLCVVVVVLVGDGGFEPGVPEEVAGGVEGFGLDAVLEGLVGVVGAGEGHGDVGFDDGVVGVVEVGALEAGEGVWVVFLFEVDDAEFEAGVVLVGVELEGFFVGLLG